MPPRISHAQDAIELHLETDSIEYVLKEPIRLAVTLQNVSADTIRIPSIELFDMAEMLFTYFEIRYPDGVVRRLKHRSTHSNSIYSPKYTGGALPPRDSIRFYLYPNMASTNVNEAGEGTVTEGKQHRWTFDEPGTYSVRVWYHMWDEFPVLYANAERRVGSNAVTFRVREPDAVEREILDATTFMGGGPGSIVRGYRVGGRKERGPLDPAYRVAGRYPHHPLTRHVWFAIGRSHLEEWSRGRPDRCLPGAEVFSRLAREHPEFYHDEVRLLMSQCYSLGGDQASAVETIEALMDSRPDLWTNYPFVEAYMRAVCAGGWLARWLEVYWSWRKMESRRGAVPFTCTDLQDN